MAEKYDMGTPIGGERKMRRLRSPLQEMDGLAGELDFEEEEQAAPATPAAAHQATAVTLEGIAALLDSRLKPVVHALAEVQQDVVRIDTNVENVSMSVQTVSDDLSDLARRVGLMEVGSPPVNQDIWKKIQKLEDMISKAKSEETPNLTAVIGGLSDAGGYPEAETWVNNTLWSGWASLPTKMYFKGEQFDNMVFAEFASAEDRDKAVETIRKERATVGSKAVWANVDQPADVRAVESFLFGFKKQLTEWGYAKKQVWVDTDNSTVTVDGIKVVQGSVAAGKFDAQWCDPAWANWELLQEAAELKALLSKTQERLAKGGDKGKGKGKRKGKAPVAEY